MMVGTPVGSGLGGSVGSPLGANVGTGVGAGVGTGVGGGVGDGDGAEVGAGEGGVEGLRVTRMEYTVVGSTLAPVAFSVFMAGRTDRPKSSQRKLHPSTAYRTQR